MKKIILMSLALLGMCSAQAQELYMPRNIKQAIEKGTRSMDGKPGKNYWQNFARYSITITAAPPNRMIKGTEDIVYINNSPDTLKNPIIRIILNSHTPGAARQFPASENYLTSGVHIDRYAENDVVKKWQEQGKQTVNRVRLTKPLAPHDSVKLSFDWHYDVSIESGREGAIDSTTFFLAYFYPRVSVIDDYNGWDRTMFVEAQEFYNDFNDYTFNVTVPKNFVVWATGDLINPTEVLQSAYAKLLSESMSTDSVLHIATQSDIDAKKVTAQNATNTWKWKAKYVPDVTIAISNRYVWDAASVVVDEKTRRRASVQAAFDNTSKDFHEMVKYGQHSLRWLSLNWPGVPYPYQKTTIVQGYADMEYPMMVNDNTQEDPNFARFVAEHEIAHTWFPFYMGINETRFGFMDEGWATTFEYLIGTADLGKDYADNLFKQFRVDYWINDPSSEQDIPIITPSNILSGAALGNNEYGKAALGYLAVKDMLGDAAFKKCLHEFINRWNGKHPTPWDMFYSFNDASGQNLNWFWSNWFFSNNYIDLAVKEVKGATITIENIGGYVAPFDVAIEYADGTKEVLHQTPAAWKANQKTTTVKLATKKKVRSIVIDGGIFMDANTKDNSWKTK
jgi:hypothetical protein